MSKRFTTERDRRGTSRFASSPFLTASPSKPPVGLERIGDALHRQVARSVVTGY